MTPGLVKYVTFHITVLLMAMLGASAVRQAGEGFKPSSRAEATARGAHVVVVLRGPMLLLIFLALFVSFSKEVSHE